MDTIESINEDGVIGSYTFKKDSFFYEGHFKEIAITPGVILTECMAQIGVVCLGILLLSGSNLDSLQIGLSNTNIDFYLPVFPNETVTVYSKKIYYRFNKLKCTVEMRNEKNKIVAKGSISGMITNMTPF